MSNLGMGTLLEGELESLCNIFTAEAPDFSAQFLSHATNSALVAHSSDLNEYLYYDTYNSLSEFHSDNTSDTSSYYQNCQFPVPHNAFLPINISVMDQTNLALAPFSCAISTTVNVDGSNGSHVCSIEDNVSDNLGSPHSPAEVGVKRKCSEPEVQAEPKTKAPPKKKARVSNDRKMHMSVESEKNAHEHESNAGEEENSDSESNVYQETNAGKVSASKELVSEIPKGKKRASKGTATDPQSLYARKRRERINERLRILQNLVPNGAKVDISTMLEEAVQYVKFLQLQIRLLSSDELWMYAPIAYNGVDINLFKRISPFSLP